MKNILILAAILAAFGYLGSVKADETWVNCATQAAKQDIQRITHSELEFNKDVCAFYNKPFNECMDIMYKASEEELRQILQGYLLHAVIIPKCGKPNASN